MVTSLDISNVGIYVEVGKTASIDRGWLPEGTGAATQTNRVGKTASIDRGWLRVSRL